MRTSPKFIVAVLLAALVCPALAAERAGSHVPAPVQPKQWQPRAAPAKQLLPPAASKPQIDCSISPDLCMTDPVARGCGEGRHWSSAGSGFAHCVDDDRVCADGKPGQRDEYDNLICADEKAAAEEAAREEGQGSAASPENQQDKEKTQ